MSITAYKIDAVGHDRTGEDYGYVNIMYRYGRGSRRGIFFLLGIVLIVVSIWSLVMALN